MACARLGRVDEAKRYREKFQQLRAGEMKATEGRHVGFNDVAQMCYQLAEFCTNAGRLYLRAENTAEVERLCRRAAQLAPRHVDSRQALAWLYRQSGRTAEAIRMLEQLAQLQPSVAKYPLEIAHLYAELGDQDKADEWRERAREVRDKVTK
jgi:tetratricopeptide (TPR) repeat protein